MTLIVGIRCSDGIVMASDGAATYSEPAGRPTILQHTEKLCSVPGNMILGVSGPMGFSQRIAYELEMLYKENKLLDVKRPEQAVKIIGHQIKEEVILPEANAAGVFGRVLGGQASRPVMSSALLALPLDRKPFLISFDYQFSSEEVRDQLYFNSIGSGQAIADTFLAFLSKALYDGKQPNLNDGQFMAYWAIRFAIEINPGGVSDPIQMMVLEKSGKEFLSRTVGEGLFAEHSDNMKSAYNALRNYRSAFNVPTATSSPIPDIPGNLSSKG